MKTIVAFDLDGVIIDTMELVRECYMRAGVIPPDDILSHPGHKWLFEQVGTGDVSAVYARKNKNYLTELARGRVKLLPPFWTAVKLASVGYTTIVLSAAPKGTEKILPAVLPVWPFKRIHCGILAEEKMSVLNLDPHACGVYIDDQPLPRGVSMATNFFYLGYDNQTTDELYDAITNICDIVGERK